MSNPLLGENFLRSKKAMYLLLFVFIALNLFTKFYHLSEESIYGDEGYSIYHAQKPLNELTDLFLHDQNPPMQIATLHFWMAAFGVSDFSAKSFSAILSILCSIVLFFFSKKFLNKEAAIFVSILFLLSNVQLFYSHEVRTYAMVQFFCICSFYYYFSLINKPSTSKVLMLALMNLLLLFSHYLTIFILITQFLCIWMYVRKNRKAVISYLISGVLVALVFLPWLKVVISNLPKSGSFWLQAPHFGELKFFIFWLNGNEFLFWLFSTIILSSIVMVVLNKRFQFFVKEFDVKIYVIFLVWYILPIALDFIIAQYSPVFLLRYFLYSSIGLCLLVGYIIVNLNTNLFVRILIFLPLLWFLLAAFDMKPQKEDDWRSVVSQVKSLQDKKTIIIVSANYKLKDFCFYYDPEAFKDYNNYTARLEKENVFCSNDGLNGWHKLNYDKFDRIIYVHSHAQFEDPENKINDLILSKGFKQCSDHTWINTGYTVYIRDSMQCNPVKILAQLPNNGCDIVSSYIGTSINGDAVLVFKTSFEKEEACNPNYKITDERSADGKYSYKLNQQDQYSPGITKKIAELNNKRSVTISAKVFNESDSKGYLIVTVNKAAQIFYRSDFIFNDHFRTNDRWQDLTLDGVLPDNIPADAELKVYFWNEKPKNIFIDKLEIIIR